MVCLFIETYNKLIICFAKFAKNSNALAYVVNHIFLIFFHYHRYTCIVFDAQKTTHVRLYTYLYSAFGKSLYT